ncbi:MAG: GDP-mannose 4,6-dehydratase, partial [Bdellovibrionales bacterium]|nr:GDP-mannose 4,6-dehydratase [Bdellovibrionales bacterium]
MTKLLITGGAGFIGSNLVFEALSEGFEVVNLDALTYAGNLANLKTVENTKGYDFVEGSITDSALVSSVFKTHKPSIVLNLAAESHVDRSIDRPDDFIQTNIHGTFTMLTEALRYYETLSGAERDAFRFIQVSTDE